MLYIPSLSFNSFNHNFIQVIWLILNITLSLQTILQNINNYIWNIFYFIIQQLECRLYNIIYYNIIKIQNFSYGNTQEGDRREGRRAADPDQHLPVFSLLRPPVSRGPRHRGGRGRQSPGGVWSVDSSRQLSLSWLEGGWWYVSDHKDLLKQ